MGILKTPTLDHPFTFPGGAKYHAYVQGCSHLRGLVGTPPTFWAG